MELSLARWDDEDGESAGYWLIRQLPGFIIERFANGWQIYCADDYIRDQGPSSDRVWGKGWEPSDALFAALPEDLLGPHKTRGQALISLESYVNKMTGTPSALSEALS